MARKKRFQSIKKADTGLMVFIFICLVAAGGLVYSNSHLTGMVVNRNMISFSERLCPNPELPVPVLIDEMGGMGHKGLVKCVARGEPIENPGQLFLPYREGDYDRPNIPEKRKPYYPGYPEY